MGKAAVTRHTILQKASELIYTRGYQATSIDEIIATTQVTKGAFFYHFRTKDEMGLAMIREILYPGMHKALIEPLLHAEDPLPDIYQMLKVFLLNNESLKVKYGCPAVNLVQEMAPLSARFNKELARLTGEWQQAIEATVKKGKASGKIRKDVQPRQVACFVISGYSGIRNFGKLTNNRDCYKIFLKELQNYLNSLK